jgi:hypothetical protein
MRTITGMKRVSEQFSFDGWNFKDWLFGNSKSIIEGTKLFLSWFIGVGLWESNPIVAMLIMGLVKLGLDIFEFWTKEVEINK